MTIRIAAIFPILFIVAFIGCGPSTSPVTGTVTLDGKPVEGLSVHFVGESDGKQMISRGRTDASGNYELKYTADTMGAIAGSYKVEIQDDPQSDEDKKRGMRKIPTKYNSATELTAEVTAGENKFDFDLTSK